MNLFYLALCVIFAVSGRSSDDYDGEEAHRRQIVSRLTNPRTSLMEGYELVTRQVATDVHMFRSYRTVSVLYYPIVSDVTVAHFTLKAEELHLNNIGSCEPQDVIINLKYGSYPAVNPDGYSFPKNFMDPSEREKIYTVEFQSDAMATNLTLENPKPGNWYALVYLKWEDPRTQKVEQQGLAPVCQTILYTDLQIKRTDSDIELIDCYSPIELVYNTLPSIFKCIVSEDTARMTLNVNFANLPPESTKVAITVQALSLPTAYGNLVSCSYSPSANRTLGIMFDPHPNAWHYIRVEPLPQDFTRIADCESYYFRAEEGDAGNQHLTSLMRDDKGRFFTFDYGFPTSDVQDATSLVNLTSNSVTVLKFRVNQLLDIGGTLSIEASILLDMKYYMGYKRPLNPKTGLLGFTVDEQYFKVVICADVGHGSTPLESGFCKFNDEVKPALFVLNSTDSESVYQKVLIPFPDNGEWYLTFRLFCDSVVCPCKTSEDGSVYYVDTDSNKTIEGGVSNRTREGVTECNSTVVLSISSTSCVEGRCSSRGNCMLNTFGGLVMSFCSCWSGFGAWDCSDATRLDSRKDMLSSVILLTTSNFLFIFSIYVAIIRLYYTEAIMYLFTMVFSTFYHACDGDAQVSYCILRLSILQFGDFYCGLMSFFVTLLAMSTLGEYLKALMQLVGAIVVALFTTWNMHSILSFLLPFAVGGSAVLISWGLYYREHRRMPFQRTYYIMYLPLGVVLVSIGLVCYAFLQTEQNYKLVHSLWHMIIALSVGFLLPDVRRGDSVNPFVPSPSYCRINFKNMFTRTPRNHIAED